MTNIAIILSGGSGSRFGGALPKQFTKLAGKAIIEYTVDVFERTASVDEIVIVAQSHHINRTWDLIKKNRWAKVTKVVTGGEERFDSTHSALQALQTAPSNSKVLFHDAVRPLVTAEIVQDCLNTLDQFEAVDVVINSADTIVEVFDDGCIKDIPNRSMMRRGQTPQGFRLHTIQTAYQKAISENRKVFTCDCGVVRAMLPHVRVATVRGSENNIKVTHPLDLFIAERLLQSGNRISSLDAKIDSIEDKTVVVFGGSSGIGLEISNLAKLSGANVAIASRRTNGVDVADLNTVQDYLDSVKQSYGDIDYVINTAGLLIKKPIDTLSLEDITALVNINYIGAVNVAIAAKQHLAKARGMLLNFTSSSYTRGRPFYALYSSSKAAIVNLTQALADEWVSDGVRVNCINPERTATPMRVENFGVEPLDLLLNPKDVAITSLNVLASQQTGIIVDVRKDGR